MHTDPPNNDISLGERSRVALEEKLGAKEFIYDNLGYIYKKLVRCDNHVLELQNKSQFPSDLTFFAECRPLLDGIISLGGTVETYRKTQEWIRDEFKLGRADPSFVLAILTLIHIVNTLKGFMPQFAKSTEAVPPGVAQGAKPVVRGGQGGPQGKTRVFEDLERAIANVRIDSEETDKHDGDRLKALHDIWQRIDGRVKRLSATVDSDALPT